MVIELALEKNKIMFDFHGLTELAPFVLACLYFSLFGIGLLG